MQPNGAVGVATDQHAAAVARVVRCQGRNIASTCYVSIAPFSAALSPNKCKLGRVQLSDGSVDMI